ncbi:response regulator [bacterium]|nr:response regulator [bacterium]
MTTVLIVDDSAADRKLAGGCLRNAGLDLIYAENGRAALDLIHASPPDLVLTDLVMPEIDGLALVETLRTEHRSITVVLMTAHGNEEIAVTALQKGAASYVPKKNLSRDLEDTIRTVLSVSTVERNEARVLNSLVNVELTFELDNSTAALRPLISHMQTQMRRLDLFEESDIVRISTALQEALVNAIEHGNLELDSALREGSGDKYVELAAQRRSEPPYSERKVHLTASFSREQATWTIRDEGRGFDPESLPDPTDPANLQRVSGRGLLLIRTFMDAVEFNSQANEIRMSKRRPVDTPS